VTSSEAPATFASIFAQLVERENASPELVRSAFDAILAGAWSPVQVGAFAAALRVRGESPEVIVAAAEALRATMAAVEHGLPAVLDTCGTGGDGSRTLNISTAAALVVAGAGVSVAKHGNRSISSQCGSADVLEALDIPIDVPTGRQAEVLRETRIAFLFAPAHHPALRHAAEARRELGVRTIFNALGPLANPARATHQLMGVYEHALRPVAARALGLLGVTRAWVVRSEDGLDEVSPCAPTHVSELAPDGSIVERTVTPEDFGIPKLERAAIAGGDAKTNAEAIRAIVSGAEHPATDAVVLNAAAALCVADGLAPEAAAVRARQSIASGAAAAVLEAWRKAAKRARVR
jgi:anthranilate phosphoribosyltransferase